MPISEQELLSIAKQKGINTSRYEAMSQQAQPQSQPMAQPQIPQQQPQPQSQGLIPDLLNKISPGLAITLAQGARGYMGKDNPEANDYSKLYTQEMIKKQFEDPRDGQIKDARINAMNQKANNPNYVFAGQDANGDPMYLPAPQGNIKMQPVGYTPNYQQRAGAQADLAGQQANFMRDVTGNNGQNNQNPFIVSDMTIGGVHAVDPQAKSQIDTMQPENSADAGRNTLAQESIAGIDEVMQTLFPDGTPQSYQRGVATGSNLPGIRLPFLGRITPNTRPDNPMSSGDDPATAKAQNVSRRIGSALAGRQLIQTGVAARPEETQKLIEQFAPGMFSNNESAYEGLKQLRQFYVDYLGRTRRGASQQSPSMRLTGSNGQSQQLPNQDDPLGIL